jgi:hypothetical protein
MVNGARQVYARIPLLPNGVGQETLNGRVAEHVDGAKFVKQAMVAEYGQAVAEAALRRVSERTGRSLEREVTLGDLTLLHQELPLRDTWRTTFTEIHERFKPGPHGSGEDEPMYWEQDGRLRIGTQSPSMPDDHANRHIRRLKEGFSQFIAFKLFQQYGWGVARRVSPEMLRLTGRDIQREVTRGDLELLHQVAEKVQSRHMSEQSVLPMKRPNPERSVLEAILLEQLKPSQLKPTPPEDPSLQVHPLEAKLSPELSQLQKLVWNDSPGEMVKQDLIQVWCSAEEEHPAREITTKDGVIECSARKEYTAVQWPGSDADVQLRTGIYEGFIRGRALVEYDSENGELRMSPLYKYRNDEESHKEQLTEFIGRYFEVGPNDPEFSRIANNILSYIRLGMDEPMMESALDVATGFGAVPADVRSDFTLKVHMWEDTQVPEQDRKVERVVSVRGSTRVSYVNRVDRDAKALGRVDPSKGIDLPKDVDLSKYCFVRQEGFVISAERLTSDPAEFDPELNLLSAGRFDTID